MRCSRKPPLKEHKAPNKEQSSAWVLPSEVADAAATGNVRGVQCWLELGGQVDARCDKSHPTTLVR